VIFFHTDWRIGTDCCVDYGNGWLLTGRRGDILDEGWLKSMNKLEWRRIIGDTVPGFGEYRTRGHGNFLYRMRAAVIGDLCRPYKHCWAA